MRKALLTILLLSAFTGIMAQEQYSEEYRMSPGDTLIWQPFLQCNNIGYKVSSKETIQFTPLHYGEKVQVIALKAGSCHLKATCGDVTVAAEITVADPVSEPTPTVTMVKPQNLPFNAIYQFNPPADHFFITVTNPENEYRETFAKIGSEEAYNNGQGIDRFWNTSTGANYYYVPEAQGWTDDVKWDFEPLGKSFSPLNSFYQDVNTEEDLSQYYVGMEPVAGIDCWHFFVELDGGYVVQYWVDPANGCTLRRQVNDNAPSEVTVYDLNYTKWFFGPKYKKSLHDKTR